ncbi:MAG: LptF/LptG family permease, partial [Kiritimatiellae bacterium]|nr:LptF/LptG family permease [Kiritimatiellia bacterium]
MRILHRYILSNFLVTFVMAMAVLTFVMMVGLVFESLKYIARGMDAMLVLRFLWQNLPGTLSYSVPVASLVSSLLVFSRLSSDSEISAMRSCGVPLSSIMRTPVLFAALLALLCLHVNDNVSPDAAYTRALRRKAFKAKDVMALLEPRTWIDMGEYAVFVARRDGEELLDLRVNQPLPGGRTREIRAASARVAADDGGRAFLAMRDVTIDPWRDDEPGMSHADTWRLPLSALAGYDDSPAARERAPVRRAKDLRTWELARD